MTDFQKVIMYIAIAFVIFLAVSIFSGIFNAISLFGGFFLMMILPKPSNISEVIV